MKEKVLYSELTPLEFRERLAAVPIAYLPLGTLEWNGEHLPMGADGITSQEFFCHLATEVGGIVLTMLFLGPDRVMEGDGVELYGMDICKASDEPKRYQNQQLLGSAYWVSEETFGIIMESILRQLQRAGFRFVVGHGHGPSTALFRDHASTWKEKYSLQCFVCRSDIDKEWLGIQVDRAAMNETSLIMALRPDLV